MASHGKSSASQTQWAIGAHSHPSLPSPNPRAPIQCPNRARASALKRRKTKKQQKKTPSPRLRLWQASVGSARSTDPSTTVRPRGCSMQPPPPPAPYLRPHDQRRRSPSPPGLSREGSRTSPRPDATSSNSPSSARAGPCNYQVRGWRRKGGEGEGKSARRAAPPGKPTATYSQPAAITSTKWRRRERSRRFDHHPPTKGARSGQPRLLVAVRPRSSLAYSDWQAYCHLPTPSWTPASREKQ